MSHRPILTISLRRRTLVKLFTCPACHDQRVTTDLVWRHRCILGDKSTPLRVYGHNALGHQILVRSIVQTKVIRKR